MSNVSEPEKRSGDLTTALVHAALREGAQHWDGLPRQIMMAYDMNAKTPREIFKHLERCGEDIPQWMRDEAEMKNLDHVISKGTRCVLIYRAMTEPLIEKSLDRENDGGAT